MSERGRVFAAAFAAAVLLVHVLPCQAAEVFKMQATPKPDGVMFGTYPREGGITPVVPLHDVGMWPMQRVSWDRWSWIETSPGVYDWDIAEFDILVDAHKYGSEAIGSVYMADRIPSFYPQDINDPATRQAAANFIKAYYLEMQARLGKVWVVIDYEMQWWVFAVMGIDPDDWANWYVFLVNEVKSVVPDAKVICNVIGDDHDYYLPGDWLTTAMSVSDYLGIDDYGLTPQIIHDDIQWLIDNYADGKDVYILENGFATWQGLSNKAHGTEEEQRDYFDAVISDIMTNFTPQVKCYLQFMYADNGTADDIEDHWGLVTHGNGREKPALEVFRQATADYPAYDITTIADITGDLEAGLPEMVTWTAGTEFEFIRVTQTLDVTQTVNATLKTTFTDTDGTGRYIVEANGNWKQTSSQTVNVSDYLVHGINTFNIFFPQEVWPGGATVTDVELTIDTDTDPIKDTFEVYIDSDDLSISWSPYLNVLPWLQDEGSPLAYGGEKSMAISYLCSISPYWGSVTREFSPHEDWTAFEGFGFYLKGQPSNKAEKIRAILYDSSDNVIISWQFFNITNVTQWTACEVMFEDVLDESEMWKLGGIKSLELKVIGQSRSSGTVYIDDLYCLSKTDVYPPLLLDADALTPTQVTVRFTEPMDLVSAEDPVNYSIVDDRQSSLYVLGAVVITDDRTVALTTTAQHDRPYKLTVSGVMDQAGNPIQAGLADTLTFHGMDTATTGVGDPRTGPGIWMDAAPNPFRSVVNVSFNLDAEILGSGPTPVEIRVFDAAGRLQRTVFDRIAPSGLTRLTWDGRGGDGRRLPAGVYFLNMRAGDRSLSRQIILTK
jgi:hypothetical protein